jgi:(1->4)-alpha-D-glucan 1-alpha-D-glucosylmutase
MEAAMNVPTATYRLQFGPSFGFKDAEAIVPYLHELGISDIYASPIFRATKGSTHGYDVTNPNELNPELGTAEDFSKLTTKRKECNMGWLQDIVPNHMAYSSENQMLMDIFRNGRASRCADFFDIFWDHPEDSLKGKVLAPFLGRPLSQAIGDGEIRIERDETGMYIRYYDIRFPLALPSYSIDESGGGLPPMERLLEKQFFRLCYWKKATEIINYRRFFYLNDFIALKVEKPEVFAEVHKLISDSVRQDVFTGLRIDHIDGLYDPARYLARLRKLAGERYIVVEKILDLDESLPMHWPVEGTTGYDFCNFVNGIFVRGENERALTETYRQFVNRSERYDELLSEKKRTICEKYMAGDVENLIHLLGMAARQCPHVRGELPPDVREAVIEIIAAFGIYRTYISDQRYSAEDRARMEDAIDKAKKTKPALADTIDLVGRFLLFDPSGADVPSGDSQALDFLMKFQQLTGPVMAKGFEDTLLYNYNRLISLSEVGASPNRFGIPLEDFHEYNTARAARWPRSLNATSTHDTKRGEDVRARINVLTEMPEVWSAKVRQWKEINSKFKSKGGGGLAPAANDEYLLYQTLIGAMPFVTETGPERRRQQNDSFRARIKEYMTKVIREAKAHSSWAERNQRYEQAFYEFTDQVLNVSGPNEFWDDFVPFQREIAAYGIFNSLSQTLLKMTSPGLPDFYQGSELWDLNLVDPDNRRPVDFEKRRRFLDQIRDKQPDNNIGLIDELLKTRRDGRIKLFLIYRVLNARRQYAGGVFEKGDYQPLTAGGRYSEHVVGFLRNHGDRKAATIVPRFLTSLIGPDELPFGTEVWKDTEIRWSKTLGGYWCDVITGQSIRPNGGLLVGDILSRFPVSLLIKSC